MESSSLTSSVAKADRKESVKTNVPSLTIENLAVGLFALRSSGPTRIATLASIERQNDDGHWIPYEALDGANGYRIIDECLESSNTTPACRPIKADETVVPVFWNGQHCSAQCAPACTSETYREGVHRLVIRDCDNNNIRYEGPVFEMPESAAMAARWQVASLTERATVSRLDPTNRKDSLQTRTPDRIVGLALRRTGLLNLGKDVLFDLSRWLKQTSFEDKVVRRCKSGVMIGVVVLHTLPNGTEDKSELALDFGCNALLIVRDQGGNRRLTSSFFDASRAEILAIMRRALPDDKDLVRLK